jgi:hypothetical protein
MTSMKNLIRSLKGIGSILFLKNGLKKIGGKKRWSNETDLDFLSSVGYIRYQECIFQPHVNFICTWTLKRLISLRKLHALPFTLCYEFNSVHANLLILIKRDGQIYFVIIIISSVFLII